MLRLYKEQFDIQKHNCNNATAEMHVHDIKKNKWIIWDRGNDIQVKLDEKQDFTHSLCTNAKKNIEGSSGIWTRDLSHPKRESYP